MERDELVCQGLVSNECPCVHVYQRLAWPKKNRNYRGYSPGPESCVFVSKAATEARVNKENIQRSKVGCQGPCPVSLGGGGAMSVPPATLSSRGVNFTSGVLRYKLEETLTEVTRRVGGASTHLAGQRERGRVKEERKIAG